MKHILLLTVLALLCSCEVFNEADRQHMTDVSLYNKKNKTWPNRCQRIEISSNVPADVFYDGRKAGQTPMLDPDFCDQEERTFILKKEGMKTVALTVNKKDSQKIKRWTTSAYTGDFTKTSFISVPATPVLPLVMTTPCSSDKCRYRNINAFKNEGRMISLATVFFVQDLVPQYYWQYAPAQYYVEMVPENEQPLSLNELIILQSKKFLLNNFTQISAGNKEYINTLSVVSQLPVDQVKSVMNTATTPTQAAEKITAEINKAGKGLQHVLPADDAFLFGGTVHILRRFNDLKKGDKTAIDDLTLYGNIKESSVLEIMEESKTAKEAVHTYVSLYFESMIANQAKSSRGDCKKNLGLKIKPAECEILLRPALRLMYKEDRERVLGFADFLIDNRAVFYKPK